MENIESRAFAGAFLQWQDEVLLMHRSLKKSIAPGLWAGIGGHIEESESSSPLVACLREIEEETGIKSTQINHLDLRYFALCKTQKNIDSIYYFIGILNERPVLKNTSEGTLHWIKLSDGVNLEMTPHVKSFYLHWLNNKNNLSLHCFLDSDIHILR